YAPELSRHYLAPAGLLEGAGLPGAAAVQRPGGGWHDESSNGPARPRSRALERGLRRAQHPSRRRPLRGEPESHANAPSAPGHSEAGPWRPAGALSEEPGGDRYCPPPARHSLCRGQLGKPSPGGLGPGLGSVARRPGDHAVYLLPAGRWANPRSGIGRDYLWAGPYYPGVAGPGERLEHRIRDRYPLWRRAARQ